MQRPVIVVLVGLPGSGKSTWAARGGYAVLSSDEIRGWLSDDVTDQSIHRRVYATQRYLLRQRLQLRRPCTFVDSTSLTIRDRRPYIKMAGLHDADAEAVYFDIPLEVCLERNAQRQRKVPPEVIADMARRLQPPSIEEGFARITVVRAE